MSPIVVVSPLVSAAAVWLLGVAAIVLYRTLTSLLTLRWLDVHHPTPAAPDAEPLVIILPAFREQTLVAETLARFTSFDYPRDRFRVLVVTTRREAEARADLRATLPHYAQQFSEARSHGGSQPPQTLMTGHLPGRSVRELWARRDDFERQDVALAAITAAFEATPTTAELVATEAERVNVEVGFRLVAHTDFAGDEGFKVGQVRFALDSLRGLLADWPLATEVRYAGIYDFDAHAPAEALCAVADAARELPPAIQQLAVPVPRMRMANTVRTRIFCIADGLAHLRRSLGIEAWWLLPKEAFRQHLPVVLERLLRPPSYGVGVGLFLRLDAISEIGGLPRIVDDLGTGWRLAFLGRTIAPAGVPVFYDAYESAEQAKKSRAFIYRGYLRVGEDYRTLGPGRQQFAGVILLRILVEALLWPYGAFVTVGAVAVLAWRAPLMLAAVMFVALASWTIWGLLGLRCWRRLGFDVVADRLEIAAAVAAAPIQYWWRGSGPRSLIRTIVARREPAFTKTER